MHQIVIIILDVIEGIKSSELHSRSQVRLLKFFRIVTKALLEKPVVNSNIKGQLERFSRAQKMSSAFECLGFIGCIHVSEFLFVSQMKISCRLTYNLYDDVMIYLLFPSYYLCGN